MKRIFICCLFLCCFKSYGQVIADPALSQMDVTDFTPVPLDAQALPLNGVVKLDVPIYNLDKINNLPAGSCKVKIGLGSKFILDPSFDITSVNSNQYFDWTAAFINGQVQITGDLKAPLPQNYSTVVSINVKGSLEGLSTVTTNFLITNHNTTVILSDENPNNNSSFLAYKIINTVPVNFTKLLLAKSGCAVNIDFACENEINVNKYEVELSQDGIHFSKAGELKAKNIINYKYKFMLTDFPESQYKYIRIKSVDADGSYGYSTTSKINGKCADASNDAGIMSYPNPVHGTGSITIAATQGVLAGMYNLSLYDIAGKLLKEDLMTLNNTNKINYPAGKLAAGQYLLKITSHSTQQSNIVRFQKIN